MYWLIDWFKEDGLVLENFKISTREYDLPGEYRKIITKVYI